MNFCVNRNCIESGIKSVDTRTYTGNFTHRKVSKLVVFPPFDGKVWIPSDIGFEYSKKISEWTQIKDLEFVSE